MKLFYYCHKNRKQIEKIDLACLTFYELTLVFSGSLHYIINGKPVTTKAGEAIFLREGCWRKRALGSAADYVSFNFYADGNEAPDFPTIITNLGNDVMLLLSACDEIYAKTMNDDNLDSIGLILECIVKQIVFNSKMQSFSPLVLQIMQYVKENLGRRLTLDEIGKVTNFSAVYCSAVFKRETGKTIVNYILDEKISKAKQLLFEGVPLAKISELVGFENYNYFSRTFKKRMGYSPLQYKATFFKTR